MSTAYHAKYFAYELSRQGGTGIERLSRSMFDACVDLNPHQIEAAVFAMRSPLSQGVLLADEVGLGKTIEAGLVLCQFWAEHRRRLLVVCPASIRKQWAVEMEEKFNLPSRVVDAKFYREANRAGNPNPFGADGVVITSMHFASKHAAEIRSVPWDLAVIDEAHKLRNAYRPSNRIGQNIQSALEDRRKILLTATPLQNSLVELYGLSNLIDQRIFGDLQSFRTQYVNDGGDLAGLRARLESFCTRTLRRQVSEYIKYTERHLITRPFQPTDTEHELYEAISGFLKRDDTYSLPQRQRHLTAMIVRKLLASSPVAVAGTLETMKARLVEIQKSKQTDDNLAEKIVSDEELDDELLEEILEGDETEPPTSPEGEEPVKIDAARLEAEIEELGRYTQWARGIGIDTKSRALLKALEIGFSKMSEIGAASKAVVFTESRRTQQFLRDFLESNGYAGKVVLFNGTNGDSESQTIYERWVERNRDTGRASGSRPVDIRMALIEHFRDKAQVMLATEAAAEGINLQFCSLVVNYDLPWNPQRIEQRIGRCHRYGQKHDVVVVNFLNTRNEADQRVYELLNEKFTLFTGVFGASDEVLGALESGVDFERRVLEICQRCRTPVEIDREFNNLRDELDEAIKARITDTRHLLLEHFDEDVHSRFRTNLQGARQQLDRIGEMFWRLTKHVLDGKASFDESGLWFDLVAAPFADVRPGRYHLISKTQENIAGEFLYRLSHPLGEHVVACGRDSDTPPSTVTFDITGHPARISAVEGLKGRSGMLALRRLVIESFEREEYLLFSAFDDKGCSLDQETCEKLFHCEGKTGGTEDIPAAAAARLDRESQRHVEATISRSLEANNHHFQEARERLERWADDMVLAVERELQDTKEQIKTLSRQARMAETFDQQHDIQSEIQELEKKKRRQRQRIFDVEDEIMSKRNSLITSLERRMVQKSTTEHLFSIRWNVA